MQKLTGTFGVYHVNPITLDQKTSSEIIELFIQNLDDRAIIIKESDRSLLKENSNDLFSASNQNAYFEKTANIYRTALKRVDSILFVLSSKSYNFNENDTAYLLPFSSKKLFYSPNTKYHAKKIERYIKIKSYESVVSSDDYDKYTETEFNSRAQQFAKTICENFQKKIAEEIILCDRYVESTLLNAIANRYDPHSNYFTEEQNDEFNAQLSINHDSFGFYLEENENGIATIAYIEPGGSAWMSNEINEGDIFIYAKIKGEKISGEDLKVDEIQDKIDKTKEDKILLTIKKPSGLLKTIKLLKQKTSSADNTVKGYVLSNATLKIGYLSLPSFYTDMQDQNQPGCANDVAKEILKLENDSISGLIIDLRNNGGGSMLETMNLAGIFIDEGPLFISKERNKRSSLIKDINRGSVFKKPILVLINEASASASELFANIVKDYHLGVVVGQSSYGKGTSQNVLPLDTNILYSKNRDAMKTNTDFIKITTGKFYRLDNSTHQGIGVTPDILLPSTPGYSFIKENKEPFFLKADSISKKVIFSPNPNINMQYLRDNSAKRISTSKDFAKFQRTSDSVSAAMNKQQKVVLKFNEFKKFKKENETMFSNLEKAHETSSPAIACSNNSFDIKLEQINAETREFNLKILQSLQKDIFINESFNVLNDLINLQKK